MKRNLLLGGIAAVFVLVGCQPSTQEGGTGATPDEMPADTATTDTMMGAFVAPDAGAATGSEVRAGRG